MLVLHARAKEGRSKWSTAPECQTTTRPGASPHLASPAGSCRTITASGCRRVVGRRERSCRALSQREVLCSRPRRNRGEVVVDAASRPSRPAILRRTAREVFPSNFRARRARESGFATTCGRLMSRRTRLSSRVDASVDWSGPIVERRSCGCRGYRSWRRRGRRRCVGAGRGGSAVGETVRGGRGGLTRSWATTAPRRRVQTAPSSKLAV